MTAGYSHASVDFEAEFKKTTDDINSHIRACESKMQQIKQEIQASAIREKNAYDRLNEIKKEIKILKLKQELIIDTDEIHIGKRLYDQTAIQLTRDFYAKRIDLLNVEKEKLKEQIRREHELIRNYYTTLLSMKLKLEEAKMELQRQKMRFDRAHSEYLINNDRYIQELGDIEETLFETNSRLSKLLLHTETLVTAYELLSEEVNHGF